MAHDALLNLTFKAHPWHGVSPGEKALDWVNAFIEIVPTDTVKYELDKASGVLKVDRPQRYSSMCPTLYGFVPQTYCGASVGERCATRHGLSGIQGDGDPLDICVLTEKSIPHGDFLLRAKPIGGLRMIDANQADDKIIAVLEGDLSYGGFNDVADCPKGLIERLEHYFLSYKQLPQVENRQVRIAEVYDRAEAHEVISRSLDDYRASFGAPETRLEVWRKIISGVLPP